MSAEQRVESLAYWKGDIEIQPMSGGITNANFAVTNQGRKYFVRIGDDIPVHGVMRFNELAASQAAYAAGVSPEVLYHEDGVLVMQFIEGQTLTPAQVREPDNLQRIIALMKKCHREIPLYFRGPALVFWVFHVIRDYVHSLREGGSRMDLELPRLLEIAEKLETTIGPVDLIFGHNDLLAANFIDDGSRLWLVDWDYAGFNSPLFDLGGLASNNELETDQERCLLESYFDCSLSKPLYRRYLAMKCASLLRESMWSMVSEIHSNIDFDYAAYTDYNLRRFEEEWRRFQQQP